MKSTTGQSKILRRIKN